MRPSTLFALILALLLGLGAVAAARFFGIFQRPAISQQPPPVKVEAPKVLVAKGNLFTGTLVGLNDVTLRPLRLDELQDYQRNPGKYLPAVPEGAYLRILAKNVEADQPLLREHLEPQSIPEGLGKRLAPGMRAIQLVLPRDQAAGGLLRVGEYVDVYLTTRIATDGDSPAPVTRTGCIARNLRIIVKRDLLWPALLPLPEEKPMQFTLEANPYRAEVIEFAKEKGLFTLVPAPEPPVGRRPEDVKPGQEPQFSDPSSKEYSKEGERVAAVVRGDRSVGEGDLERIFDLKPLPIRVGLLRVERIIGTSVKGVSEFPDPRGVVLAKAADLDQPGYGYRFSQPEVRGMGSGRTVPAGTAGKTGLNRKS